MVLKVANSLVIGTANPVALPFSFKSGIPAGMHADAADVDFSQTQGTQVSRVSLRICTTSPCASPYDGLVLAQQTNSLPAFESIFRVLDAPQPGLPNSKSRLSQDGEESGPGTPVTVGGHAAELWTDKTGATVVFGYDGTDIIVSVGGPEYPEIGGRDGFLAFCDSLSWYGANPAHWTTDVIPTSERPLISVP